MENIACNTYIKEHGTKDWLSKNDFIYSRKFSDVDDEVYAHRFHVYKYGDVCILDCELLIFKNTGKVIINVYDYKTRNIYAPFYHVEFGNYDRILSVINEKIENELKRLQIRKVNADEDKSKTVKKQCKNANKRKCGGGRK